MKAFYEARVEHLGPEDHVLVECVCGHTEGLSGAMLLKAGVAANGFIQDLSQQFQCRECDERGKVMLLIKWANEPVNPMYPEPGRAE